VARILTGYAGASIAILQSVAKQGVLTVFVGSAHQRAAPTFLKARHVRGVVRRIGARRIPVDTHTVLTSLRTIAGKLIIASSIAGAWVEGR
jgi:hypothetical protein